MNKSSSGKIKTLKNGAPYRTTGKTINNILDKKTMNQLAHLSNKMMKKKISANEQARVSSRLSQGNINKSQGIESNRSNSVNKPRRKYYKAASKNFDQNRVSSPNEDIPVETIREKLSHDIDETLSSLKRKRRSTINLETNTH
jgi:hypothetical protein